MSTALEPSAGDLTPAEVDQLAAEEATIEAGQTVFMKVGMALARIRDARLYRASHPTFAEYVDQRWGFTRIRAYQLIEAGVVAAEMSTMVDIPEIENERQARALAPVVKESGPEAAAEVLREVKKSGGKVTAKAIKAKAKKSTQVFHKNPLLEQLEAKANEQEPEKVKVTVIPAPESEPIKVKAHVAAQVDDTVPTVEAIEALSLREVIDLDRSLSEKPSNLRSNSVSDAIDAVESRLHALWTINDSVATLPRLTLEDMAEVAALADWRPTVEEITAAINALTRLRDVVDGSKP